MSVANGCADRIDTNFQYPFAAAPDIIRSNQKDTYFHGVLLENLSNILRKLYGARFVHNHASEARTFAEFLYLGCTTLIGNRTLGEEYCDIIQVEDDSFQLPSIFRRGGYIVSTILLPFLLSNFLPFFRVAIRLKLESGSSSRPALTGTAPSRILYHPLQTYLLDNLPTLTSPSPLYAFGLSVFYFSGAYYHLGKRWLGLRYIFTKRVEPSDQRIGYEVLGVLLLLQMSVQGWIHFRETFQNDLSVLASRQSKAGGNAVISGGGEVSLDSASFENNSTLPFEPPGTRHTSSIHQIDEHTHTPLFTTPKYGLANSDMMNWIHGKQQRKCTLCLDDLINPSVTTCGHVFCWTCIADWLREKPECPLCRQGILGQHVLPLRG